MLNAQARKDASAAPIHPLVELHGVLRVHSSSIFAALHICISLVAQQSLELHLGFAAYTLVRVGDRGYGS